MATGGHRDGVPAWGKPRNDPAKAKAFSLPNARPAGRVAADPVGCHLGRSPICVTRSPEQAWVGQEKRSTVGTANGAKERTAAKLINNACLPLA